MRTLLIDGDVLAYKAALTEEKATEWEPGYWTWHCDEFAVRDALQAQVDRLMDELEGDDYRLCLTDSGSEFRVQIYPTYKGNRKTKKPLVLKAIKQWMIDELGAYLKPGLEGDDCMGILATHPSLIKGEKVIVSIDKDMKTIPGLYVRDLETGMVEISEASADYWFMFQTLTGDTTDGYPGCPGVGPKKAEKLLEKALDGFGSMGLTKSTVPYAWPSIVAAYEKAGLDEHAAITQARMARILRASDYDFKKKEVVLWTP